MLDDDPEDLAHLHTLEVALLSIVTPTSRMFRMNGYQQQHCLGQTINSGILPCAGLYYPHVSGERLIKRADCVYHLSSGLVQKLLKSNARLPQPALVAVAKSFRIAVSGPAISWTATDGGPMDHAEVVGPCKWWLLVPLPGTRWALDTKFQTLTVEEQHAHMYGSGQVAGSAGAAQIIAEEAENAEEGDADFEEDVPLDCGGDMELDS